MSADGSLRENFKKLKAKIIDTGKLLELYKSTKRNLEESVSREYELLRYFDQSKLDIGNSQESINSTTIFQYSAPPPQDVEYLKLKLNAALKALAPLNIANKQLTEEVEKLKAELVNKNTCLESKNIFIEQLQADIDSKRSKIHELGNIEDYKKEIRRLKEEVNEKDRRILELKSKVHNVSLKKSERSSNFVPPQDQPIVAKPCKSNIRSALESTSQTIPESEISSPIEKVSNKSLKKIQLQTENLMPVPKKPVTKKVKSRNSKRSAPSQSVDILLEEFLSSVEEPSVIPDLSPSIPTQISKKQKIADYLQSVELRFIDTKDFENSIVQLVTDITTGEHCDLPYETPSTIAEIAFLSRDFSHRMLVSSLINSIIAVTKKCEDQEIYSLIEQGLPAEDTLLDIIWNVSYYNNQNNHEKIVTSLLDMISMLLMNQDDSIKPITKVTFSRLFSKLCGLMNQRNRTRVFIYDLIREPEVVDLQILFSLELATSSLMSLDEKFNGQITEDTSVLNQTILFTIKELLNEQNIPEFNVYRDALNWNLEDMTIEGWSEILICKLKNSSIDSKSDLSFIFEIIKSLELLSKIKGYRWTQEILERTNLVNDNIHNDLLRSFVQILDKLHAHSRECTV